MSLRYKVGDRVVLGNADVLAAFSISKEYRHCIGIIVEIDEDDEKEPYKTEFEDGQIWWTNDNCIDHEATATLNFKVDKDKFDDAISSMAYAVQDLGASMRENLNRVCNKIRCSKGGETMNANEILEKWQNKRYVELRSKAEDEKQKVTKQDEIQKLFEEHEVAIQKTIKEKYKVDVEVEHTFFVVTTSKTSKKLAEIEDKCKAEERELDEKINEIKAVLEVAENQDKVFEILNKQGIIDKNYNIL